MRSHQPIWVKRILGLGCLNDVQKPDPSCFVGLLPDDDAVIRRLPSHIALYCVGGAVRDRLLGTPVSDRDYVGVGASVEDMLEAGFTPVGKDFPVFLHPVSHDEYALARTERKSGKGYKGFVFKADPGVSLEEDLSRRDLTINAMAVSSRGELFDPLHGLDDLSAKILRHVGPAFSEDPVRLLRLARFAARWPDMQIAEETMALCRSIAAAGEVDALVPERVWQELSIGLMEAQPSNMVTALVKAGAWSAVTASTPLTPATCAILDRAAESQAPLEVRFALFADNSGVPISLSQLRLPGPVAALASLLEFSRSQLAVIKACMAAPRKDELPPLLDWLSRADAARRPERMHQLLQCHHLSGALSQAELDRLKMLMECMAAPEASALIAQAAKDAAERSMDVAAAVSEAKLAVLDQCIRR
jgi:tRNA nucleotidyltransferase (CCA-adding enzyme)